MIKAIPSELLKPAEQEKRNFVVEKFREILHIKPQHERLVIDGHTKKERKDEINLFYAWEGGWRPSGSGIFILKKEIKWEERHAALRGNDPLVFTKKEDAKTTIEQINYIIRMCGKPSTIFYSRLDYEERLGSEGENRNDSIPGAYFPFDEIEKDLGFE